LPAGTTGLDGGLRGVAKTKQKIGRDFDAILAGLDQQPAEKAPDYRARRKTPKAEAASNGGATENSPAAC
jgi:hypothetical protein